MKKRLLLSILTAVALMGCDGTSSSGVSPDEAPTASTLSVEYTGSTLDGGSGTSGNCELTVSWTQCPDADFASYTLYRSSTSGISGDTASADLMGTFSSSSTVQFVDNSVFWDTPYYYILLTRDDGRNYSWSNEVNITTPTY